MSERNIKAFLYDIIDHMEKAEKFVKGMEFEEFVKHEITIFATIRALEVIGEATKNIPDEIRVKYSDIPWRGMAGMRDKLIHFYFGIDYELVWKVVKNDIPQTRPKIEKILKELSNE
ncbi:MAG: hypothetical protein PWP15_22 [Methanothermococcus sp.]|jgi:uncharacterized protein with HEPN domain|uniref:HepT-like ribonuclease domain-containing protein n=1 Tax=Methanothermococcus TaxID=155862 RepID=UPI00036CDDA3|nr:MULTISPECIES: DUF86 domain-containing protein [Methanothermococcus]MDK2789515.1 hypothetical protein [Methanothermococcus sp.]MDK2987442.1 hypothetical protein [Methanothermococcus sp.]